MVVDQLMLHIWLSLFMGFLSSAASKGDQSLVLIGGNLRDDHGAIYDKIVELCGGRGSAKIGIVTAASEDAIETGAFYKSQFEKFGAKEAYWIPIHQNDPGVAFDPLVALKVRTKWAHMFSKTTW